MSSIKILHNPRCSKSRQTLALLQENGVEPEIVEYLKNTPSNAEMQRILAALNAKPADILRKKEDTYKELNLKSFSGNDDELLEVMLQNPKLIERPIVVNGSKAAIGRPPEAVLDIL